LKKLNVLIVYLSVFPRPATGDVGVVRLDYRCGKVLIAFSSRKTDRSKKVLSQKIEKENSQARFDRSSAAFVGPAHTVQVGPYSIEMWQPNDWLTTSQIEKKTRFLPVFALKINNPAPEAHTVSVSFHFVSRFHAHSAHISASESAMVDSDG
jgi:hypothetical protein